jgi:GT2 family glycosyltransferase
LTPGAVPAPRFSIVTPVYETPPGVLRKMLRSVTRQSFEDWELCLVDDCSPSPEVGEILARAARRDPRIRVARRAENGGIVAASNDALAMAGGEFIALLDHDDILHPDALALVSERIDATPDVDYVYSDEDKVNVHGVHSAPFFKPDWSPERMRTQMYTCHLSVLRRSLVEEVGGFDAGFEGAQDWDLVLKVTERARAIAHIPRILYSWRTIATSAASGGEAVKPYAFEAGQRAVQAHCDRIGLPARVERDPEDSGVLHLEPELTEEPLISIVIPTNGQSRQVRFAETVLVEHCVRSIVESSTYSNYEIVAVLDEHTPDEVAEELDAIAGDRLRVVTFHGPFDFSAKINLGAEHSRGEYLLLLNDDMEVITPNWIERLVMYVGQDGVGAVGGRLLWSDGRLQHVGIGFDGGLPGHAYHGFSGEYRGYANHVVIARNCLGVTGACLMTPKAAFEEVGGLTELLPLNFNDVDFCLKLHAKGWRMIYDPDAILFHFESSTRDPEVKAWEERVLVERWINHVAVDPYGNPNLSRGMPRIGSAMLAWAKRRRPKLRQLV